MSVPHCLLPVTRLNDSFGAIDSESRLSPVSLNQPLGRLAPTTVDGRERKVGIQSWLPVSLHRCRSPWHPGQQQRVWNGYSVGIAYRPLFGAVYLTRPASCAAVRRSLEQKANRREVGATVYGSPSLDLDALREFLGEHLARFEVPLYLRKSDAPPPRAPSGKILKRQIRDAALVAGAPQAAPPGAAA